MDEAEKKLKMLSLEQVGELALLDLDRAERSGIPEVIMAETKSSEDIVRITKTLLEKRNFALISRIDDSKVKHIQQEITDVEIKVYGKSPIYTILVSKPDWTKPSTGAKIALVTAGTSDIPYAEEAKSIAEVMGVEALTFFDVGVSGIHRLIKPMKEIISKQVSAIVVFAGMEGALPTVIASLTDIPVIGVPIPVGYGFGGKGETALASMLQSCAPGLAVVNIGNGIGGGAMASLIALQATRKIKD